MAMPVAITPGRSSVAPPAITAGGVTSTAAMIMAMTSPDDPANRRPVARLSKMYAAQQPADTRAKITPATSAPCPPTPSAPCAVPVPPRLSRRTPAPASATQSRSITRRDDATATASGPRNSIVTAIPSGIRANAW